MFEELDKEIKELKQKWEGHARLLPLGEGRKVPEHESFTPEAEARCRFRSNKPFYSRSIYFNKQASRDGIRHFVDACGDRNPLFKDEKYAKKTKYGKIIAPVSYLYSIQWPYAGYGAPGIHGWYVGGNWECYRPIFEGDEFDVINVIRDLVVKEGKMGGGRTWIQYGDCIYVTDKGEIVAKELGHIVFAERAASGTAGKYRKVPKPEYSREDWVKILEIYDREELRGAEARYWEDVQVGDRLGSCPKTRPF